MNIGGRRKEGDHEGVGYRNEKSKSIVAKNNQDTHKYKKGKLEEKHVTSC